jgi:simple sugar transport system permease protein
LYAAWAGYKFTTLGHIPHVTLCIAIAIITGSLWMLLPALLKVYAGVSEIISTIILNFVAVLFVSYMANGPFRGDPIAPATPRILETAELKQYFPNSQFNTGFFIAVFVAFLTYFILKKTTFGYELRSGGDGLVGFYPSRYSSYLGIPSDRSAITGMLISGGLGGLAGGIEILGNARYFYQELLFNQGFDGILIAIVGKLEPIGGLIASLFWSALRNGGLFVDYKTEVSREIVVILLSILIFFVSAQKLVSSLERFKFIRKLDAIFTRKIK